jgi:hypothetical protein
MTIKSKKSGGYSPKYGAGLPCASLSGHEGLKDREENARILGDTPFFAYLFRIDTNKRLEFGMIIPRSVKVGPRRDSGIEMLGWDHSL